MKQILWQFHRSEFGDQIRRKINYVTGREIATILKIAVDNAILEFCEYKFCGTS